MCGLRVGVFCLMTWRQKTRAHPLVKSCGFSPGTVLSGQLGALEGASTVAADAGTLAAPGSGASWCPCPSWGCCSSFLLAPGRALGGNGLQPRREVASLTPTFPWEPSHGKGKRGADEGRTRAGTGCSAPLRHGAAAGCAAGVPLLLFPPLSTPSDVAVRGVAGHAVPCWERFPLPLRWSGCSERARSFPNIWITLSRMHPPGCPAQGRESLYLRCKGREIKAGEEARARSHAGRWAHGCPGLRATEVLRRV